MSAESGILHQIRVKLAGTDELLRSFGKMLSAPLISSAYFGRDFTEYNLGLWLFFVAGCLGDSASLVFFFLIL